MARKLNSRPELNSSARYRLWGGVMVIAVLVVLWRVLVTMYQDGEEWRHIGESLHRPQEENIYPYRGTIYSADGEELAITAPHYRLYMDFQAEAFKQLDHKSAMLLLDSLSLVLSEKLSTPEELIKASYLKAQWIKGYNKKSRSCLLVNKDISYLDVKEMYAAPPFRDKENHSNRALTHSIVKVDRAKRINPYGSLGRRTIGSVYAEVTGGLTRGKGGLELAFDSLLRGELGKVLRLYNAGRVTLNTIREPKPGANVHSTLDMRKQAIVEHELRSSLELAEAESGTAVLMEVATGKILAISNLGRLKSGAYAETQNFAVSDLSEPGSTFKTVSMLIALDQGLCTPEDTVDVGNGIWQVGNRRLMDWTVGKRAGLGRISYAEAMHQSSNVGIAKLIQKNFKDRPKAYVQSVRKMGLCDNFDLDIPGAAKHAIVRFPEEGAYWSATTLPWMAHGYETQIPPISTLAFYNAIANGGRFMKPYFVNKVVSPNGEILIENSPTVLHESIASEQAIMQIKDILRGVVTSGTAKRGALSDKVALCGKTGTAVLGNARSGYSERNYQISFAGFFPYEAPKYSMIVVVRKPHVPEYRSAGISCGGVMKRVAETIMSIESRLPIDSMHIASGMKIPHIQSGKRDVVLASLSTAGLSERMTKKPPKTRFVQVKQSGKQIELHSTRPYSRGVVPDLVGMSPSDAVYALAGCGFRSVLHGFGPVFSQSIPAGSRAAIGQKVHLYLTHRSTMSGSKEESKLQSEQKNKTKKE